MKAENIIALLTRIEKTFEVDTWIIDGIHVWPLIRLDLMMSLHFSESENQQIKVNLLFKLKQATNMFFGFVRYVYKALSDFRHNARVSKVDAIILGNGISRVFLGGKWYDRFCDPLVLDLRDKGMTSFMMESRHNYLVPRFSPSKFVQPFLDFSLLKKMIFKKNQFYQTELKDFESFVDFIQAERLQIPIPDERRLKTIVLVIKAYFEYYQKILKLTKPSVGFVPSYYGPLGLAFNLACHELNIPSVDIQHGVAGASNAAYGHWNKVPSSGYEVLPSIFWCWSKEDAAAIEQWNTSVKDRHKPLIGGNRFVDLWKSGRFDHFSTDTVFEDPKSINILVTLSSVEEHNSILLAHILAIIDRFKPHWKWWIRLHPCLKKQRKNVKKMFQNVSGVPVDVDKATDLPLYLLLRHMQLHITHVSATIREAQCFGVPSVFAGEDGKEYFSEQISSGWAVYAETPEEIEAAIRLQLGRNAPKLIEKNELDSLDTLLAMIHAASSKTNVDYPVSRI